MKILSGIQPSGQLHIGNYFGMMLPMIRNMEKGELYAFIVNLHALTSVHDQQKLAAGTLEAAADFIALGLDPDRCVFWVQGDVPEVTELTWILSTLTAMGLLERCHSYKDKIAKGLPTSVGLFTYPVLQAADILIYDAELVPVGQDPDSKLWEFLHLRAQIVLVLIPGGRHWIGAQSADPGGPNYDPDLSSGTKGLRGLRAVDALGLLPRWLTDEDPLYTSLFVAHLGSVGLEAAYHHLWEYGTCSIFATIGRLRRRTGGKRFVEIKYSFDERIEDGYYAARSLQEVRQRLEDPETLG